MTMANDHGPPRRKAEGAATQKTGTPPELTPPVDDLTTLDFARRLGELLDVPLIVRPPQPKYPEAAEFYFPTGQRDSLSSNGNAAELAKWRLGWAIMARMAGNVAVVDVDPRNSGDVDRMRQLLVALHVRVHGAQP